MELSDIKGIKEKRIQELHRVGIKTPMDLLSYFPTDYVDLNNLTDFSAVSEGERVVFSAVFTDKPKTAYIRKNLCLVKVKFEIEGVGVTCTWFNQKYFASSVAIGKRYYIIGKVKRNGKFFEVINPKVIAKDKCRDRFLVFYKPLKNVPSAAIASAINSVLQRVKVVSFIPKDLREEYGLMDLSDAYRCIHVPQSLEEIANAKQNVSIEYLNYKICVYEIIKQKSLTKKTRSYDLDLDALGQVISGLPFELSSDQRAAVCDIIGDMRSEMCMNRLLQGDVGSGKTVVAFLAMYYAYLSGYQSVIMCPTEILARQHFETLCSLFPSVQEAACLLCASVPAAQKKEITDGIARGRYKFIVGTHSVFGDKVDFCELALVITDEQHRFGVNQRSSLENKSRGVDCLVMSATPIPRTLALTLYGDLKRSVIKTLSKNKAMVTTKVVPPSKLDSMWTYFEKCADNDDRTYVVCARIDNDEDTDLISCKALFDEKKKFHKSIGLLHGQMSENEKNAVMRDFASGKIKVLISTTVIEVGIDVPAAVNIAIYNPERYGLSQLHQLRGRVGRGAKNGYCFLVNHLGGQVPDRLKYLENCSDGFELAEYDFEQRGAGDFLGNAQHGNGDLIVNSDIIATAKEISDRIMQNDAIRDSISDTIDENRYVYYKNITLN